MASQRAMINMNSLKVVFKMANVYEWCKDNAVFWLSTAVVQGSSSLHYSDRFPLLETDETQRRVTTSFVRSLLHRATLPMDSEDC